MSMNAMYRLDKQWLTLGMAVLLAMGCSSNEGVQAPSAREACAAFAGKTLGAAVVQSSTFVDTKGDMPEYCEVKAKINPQLNFSVRLPSEWNGKLVYSGGGGFDGSVYPVDASALRKGFAQVASDSGHQGNTWDASWALNDELALNNYGYLSTPTVMTDTLKIVKQRYGRGPALSYFEGCSNGGREALMNAQRFPELFDGILAAAPAYNITGLFLAFNRVQKALVQPGAALPKAKITTLARAVLAACDRLDGVADGIVSNIEACKNAFNPATLRCPDGIDTGDACLSDPQLHVVQTWASEYSLANGRFMGAAWPLSGNEDEPKGWPYWVTGDPAANMPVSAQFGLQDGMVRYILTKNPMLNSLSFEPEEYLGEISLAATLLDATNANLTPFRARSGKLILWHGTSDTAIPVGGTSKYYLDMVREVGGQVVADEFVRYYTAPGVLHCGGGPGADSTDLLGVLDDWVASGRSPGELVAEKVIPGSASMSRPLCLYPKYPHYVGAGNVNAASSYRCQMP